MLVQSFNPLKIGSYCSFINIVEGKTKVTDSFNPLKIGSYCSFNDGVVEVKIDSEVVSIPLKSGHIVVYADDFRV